MKPFLTLALLAALLAGCKQDKVAPKDQLPPATTAGANTWGCLVNGEVWKGETASQMRADWTTPIGLALTLGCWRNGKYYDVNVFLPDSTNNYALQAGTYFLLNKKPRCFAFVTTPAHNYNGDPVLDGTVVITRLSYSAGVVAGTFNFSTVGPLNDTVRVTNGRFDFGEIDR